MFVLDILKIVISRTHNLIAFASLLTATVYFSPVDLTATTMIVALVANSVGSLMPDLDQATNKIWDMLPLGDSVGKFLSNMLFGHRSLSHSFIGMFGVYKLVYWLFPMIFNSMYINYQLVCVSLLIGYYSHIVADGLTEEGVPLLYPIKIKFGFPPIKSWRIKTDHWFEKLVITPSLVVFIFWFTLSNWGKLFGGLRY